MAHGHASDKAPFVQDLVAVANPREREVELCFDFGRHDEIAARVGQPHLLRERTDRSRVHGARRGQERRAVQAALARRPKRKIGDRAPDRSRDAARAKWIARRKLRDLGLGDRVAARQQQGPQPRAQRDARFVERHERGFDGGRCGCGRHLIVDERQRGRTRRVERAPEHAPLPRLRRLRGAHEQRRIVPARFAPRDAQPIHRVLRGDVHPHDGTSRGEEGRARGGRAAVAGRAGHDERQRRSVGAQSVAPDRQLARGPFVEHEAANEAGIGRTHREPRLVDAAPSAREPRDEILRDLQRKTGQRRITVDLQQPISNDRPLGEADRRERRGQSSDASESARPSVGRVLLT